MMSNDHSHQWQQREQKEDEKEGKEPAAKKAKTDILAVIEEKREAAIKELIARLEEHDKNRRTEQEKLHNKCSELRKQIDAMEDSLNGNLEKIFTTEDSRLQSVLAKLRELNVTEGDNASIAALKGAIQMARAELTVKHSYKFVPSGRIPFFPDKKSHIIEIVDEGNEENKHNKVRDEKNEHGDGIVGDESNSDEEPEEGNYGEFGEAKQYDSDENGGEGDYYNMLKSAIQKPSKVDVSKLNLEKLYKLYTKVELLEEFIDLDSIWPEFNHINGGRVYVKLLRNEDLERVLKENGFGGNLSYKALLYKGNKSVGKYELRYEGESFFSFMPHVLEAEASYNLVVSLTCADCSAYSDPAAFIIPVFSECCAWKECPDRVYKRYSVDEESPRVATKINGHSGGWCTIIGNTALPQNKVTSWGIKILKSLNNDGNNIYIGVAPSYVNKNEDDNYNKCGWYFCCYNSTLWSGPPHSYRGKEYGPRKRGWGEYVHTGDSVGVVMDTTNGELSFAVSGANLGVAYDGIPLDKPLVPCTLLRNEGDSIELDTSEVKDKVNDFIPFPLLITAKNGITWDSITLLWNSVEGATFYQIEVDGSKFWDASTTNTFTKTGLFAETEHSFRVRAVCGNEVSEWSGAVKGRTQKESFETSRWKECPDNVDEWMKYSVNKKNPRTAAKINSNGWCTIIGNTSLPHNKVTSWNIKILKSLDKDGSGVYIGVAPSDINQNEVNYNKCGWYFYCGSSTLYSGPPHSYKDKEYGPRKRDRQYIHTGDTVGVVMDTTKGELSFVVNGVNLGVAYDRIPLDKPFVPCVILRTKDDSVGLDTSGVKETSANSSTSVPSNISIKSITWDSITLSWDAVEETSFYQIEVDGNKFWDASTTSTFTKGGLQPDTEHSFRVRAVCGSEVSEWSGVVKGRTQKKTFETGGWKEYQKTSLDNPTVITKLNGDSYSTISWSTALPQNKVTSWNIKILKHKFNTGSYTYVGVAPFDIDQNEGRNFEKRGWYFYCYYSTLHSGPPHNYRGKEYGTRKRRGRYVHTGDSVGVVMDTAKGELSFVLNGVNLGVAYKGIPLNKPLVPCTLLYYEGDSVELIF